MTMAQAELQVHSFLEQRAQQLSVWADKCRVGCLLPEESSMITLNSILVKLVSSRVCCAQDCIALVAVSRGSCCKLAKFEALIPLFDLVLRGLADIRFLGDAAVFSLQDLEARSESAKVRLEALTKTDLVSLKAEVHSSNRARPFVGQPALEIASQILQPTQKIHDDFACRRLVSDLRVAERAILFNPLETQQMQLAHRQRIMKQFAMNSEAISSLASKPGALGALAEWLQVVNQSLCDWPKIRDTYRAKQAVASHIVPLAKWALRPHGSRSLLGRPKPPKPVASLPASLRKVPANLAASSSGLQFAHRDSTSTLSIHVPKAPASRPQSARSRIRDKVADVRDGNLGHHLRSRTPTTHECAAEVSAVPQSVRIEKESKESSALTTPSLQAEETFGPGLGATRRLELWLREHGRHARHHLRSAYDEVQDVKAKSLLLERMKHGPTSTCSTASTAPETCDDQEQTPQLNAVANFAASAPAGSNSSPCSTLHSPALSCAPKAGVQHGCMDAVQRSLATTVSSAVAAATESPCLLLELSSDEEDIFELGGHSPLDVEGTSIAGSWALHMRSQRCK